MDRVVLTVVLAQDLLAADSATARSECNPLTSQNEVYLKKPEIKLSELSQFARNKGTFRHTTKIV